MLSGWSGGLRKTCVFPKFIEKLPYAVGTGLYYALTIKGIG